jgi:hypothetical protein
MTIRVKTLQTPVERREPTQPMIAMASANWMTRKASLVAHMPLGEIWGGGGLACSMVENGRRCLQLGVESRELIKGVVLLEKRVNIRDSDWR